MSRNEVTNRIKHIAGSWCREHNPHLFGLGAVGSHGNQPNPRAPLDRQLSPQKARLPRVAGGPVARVAFVVLRRKGADLTDSDGAINGLKPLRDLVARELGIDDHDSCIEWEKPVIMKTTGQEGTIVKVEML